MELFVTFERGLTVNVTHKKGKGQINRNRKKSEFALKGEVELNENISWGVKETEISQGISE